MSRALPPPRPLTRLAITLLGVLFAGEAIRADFDYPDFGSVTGLTLVGSATQVGTQLQLTPNIGQQSGACYHVDQENISAGFETFFDFQLSGDGADGFTFIVQAQGPAAITTNGAAGSTMGYADGPVQCGYAAPGAVGISQSCAVEFDSWDSGPCFGEPTTPRHIAIQPSLGSNSGNYAVAAGGTDTPPNWEDGAVHSVRIVYDPSVPVMRVYLDDLDNALFEASFDLEAAIGASDVWVGFTGATGGVTAAHSILNWSFTAGASGGPTFRRGDVNDDGAFDVSDAVFLLAALFIPMSPAGDCADAADINDDGVADISDAVFGLASLFIPMSPAPPDPGPLDCDVDPSPDTLPACVSTTCP